MHKKTLAKLAGFGIAAACTATLVGFAANGTGAYFTNTKAGSFNVSTGTVEVKNTTNITGLDFTNLLPGVYRPQTVSYNITGSGAEDIYLELPNDPALTAVPTPGPSPLGRYGHFKVQGPAGVFSSFNLSQDPNDPNGETDGSQNDCQVTSTGLSVDGQGQTAEAPNKGTLVPYCAAPKFILLSSGMTSGGPDQTVTITFGFTGLLSNTDGGTPPVNEQASPQTSMPFNLVAVQTGVSPTDARNNPGSGF